MQECNSALTASSERPSAPMPAIIPPEPATFAQAMELERISPDEEVYLSKYPALAFDSRPGQPLSTQRSYGGHSFAQSIWAASLAIKDSGLCVHEANGYWVQAGHANRPFIYEVQTLSQTRSFVLRQVTARQPTSPSEECPFPASDASKALGPPAFVLTCSFKRSEPGSGYGVKFDADKYGELLRTDPASLSTDAKVPSLSGVGKIKLADFPGLDCRTPDLTDYNQRVEGVSRRRLHLYRASLPVEADPNLLAAVHAYVSDRAGLSVVFNAFGAKQLGMAGSLNHKVVFHVNPEELKITDQTWFIQEMSSSRGGEGRGTIETRIWGPSGDLVVSTVQDAMFRQPVQAKLS